MATDCVSKALIEGRCWGAFRHVVEEEKDIALLSEKQSFPTGNTDQGEHTDPVLFPWASQSAVTQQKLSICFRCSKHRHLCRETDMGYTLLWMSGSIYPIIKERHLEEVQIQNLIPFLFPQLLTQVRYLALYQAFSNKVVHFQWSSKWGSTYLKPVRRQMWKINPEDGHGAVLQSRLRHFPRVSECKCLLKKQQAPQASQARCKHKDSQNWMTASAVCGDADMWAGLAWMPLLDLASRSEHAEQKWEPVFISSKWKNFCSL